MRRPSRAAPLANARAALICAALAGALLVPTPAAAQTAAAGSTTPPAPATPTADPGPPAAPPAGGAAPSLEAGDTAAPGAPVQPLLPPSATGTPPPGAPPPAVVQGSLGSLPPREQRPKVYETRWFWGAVGVVVVTAAIVLALGLSSRNPTTPSTKLGDMRAF
ncbi:MAG TPA: hypothetical protein VLA14_18310 [Polyangia bacterium]|jgi:hypothetical protein|nr:hypothetical protein [Polyangia bacterium]